MANLLYAHGVIRENSKVNVVCFPYAGGTASNFSRVKKFLSEDFSVYPVLYPLRERRFNQPMPNTVEELVQEFVDSCEDIFRKPFIMFGYCTGSIIAYEAAKYIEKKMQVSPLCFIAAASMAPDRRVGKEGIENMSDDDFIKMLYDTGRISNEAEKVPNFKEYYLPIMRADFSVLGRYNFQNTDKLNCPIITFSGSEDEQIPQKLINEWNKYTDFNYSKYSFDGGHYFIDDNMEEVCNLINKLV